MVNVNKSLDYDIKNLGWIFLFTFGPWDPKCPIMGYRGYPKANCSMVNGHDT